MERKVTWETYDAEQLQKLEKLNQEYREFLDNGKTERECIDTIVNTIEAEGYRELESLIQEGRKLQKGDKVYSVCMNKSIAMFQIGEKPMTEGMNILGAHIDSPRIDVKQNPLYEDGGFAYLDTHYYGGVKKYQWVALPLALHGVVVKKDGTTIEMNIGENDDDPVFFISDLLIHLAGEQMEKKAKVVIEGENLDVLIGSRPLSAEDVCEKAEETCGGTSGAEAEGCCSEEDKKGKTKDAVKAAILKILKESYGMEEEDFLSAELEIVPAGKARDCGLDRSMVAAYGQDDRVCGYTSLAALLEMTDAKQTCCCLLVDKEEIGSVGATGMQSRFFENTVAELMNCMGQYSELDLRRCLANCKMLSSDVSAAYDPLYAQAFEKKNAAYFAKGLVFNKYTGSAGKGRSNDANAEYIGWIRRVMEEQQVAFQTAELGKVDVGGGGTIAYISALYGMEVIDSGVPVLNMHAPMEITSKADIYEAKKGYLAFLKG